MREKHTTAQQNKYYGHYFVQILWRLIECANELYVILFVCVCVYNVLYKGQCVASENRIKLNEKHRIQKSSASRTHISIEVKCINKRICCCFVDDVQFVGEFFSSSLLFFVSHCLQRFLSFFLFFYPTHVTMSLYQRDCIGDSRVQYTDTLGFFPIYFYILDIFLYP